MGELGMAGLRGSEGTAVALAAHGRGCAMTIDVSTYSKRCSRCHRGLPITSFNVNRSRKDGYQHRCKRCEQNLRFISYPERRLPGLREEYARTGRCDLCENMSWRRESPHCPCCLEAFEEEDTSSDYQEIVERRRFIG